MAVRRSLLTGDDDYDTFMSTISPFDWQLPVLSTIFLNAADLYWSRQRALTTDTPGMTSSHLRNKTAPQQPAVFIPIEYPTEDGMHLFFRSSQGSFTECHAHSYTPFSITNKAVTDERLQAFGPMVNMTNPSDSEKAIVNDILTKLKYIGYHILVEMLLTDAKLASDTKNGPPDFQKYRQEVKAILDHARIVITSDSAGHRHAQQGINQIIASVLTPPTAFYYLNDHATPTVNLRTPITNPSTSDNPRRLMTLICKDYLFPMLHTEE